MNVRLSILLVVILVLIGGSVGITYGLRGREPREQVPWLFKIGFEDIIGIAVTHNQQRMAYELQGEQWVIKDGKDTPVFAEKWAGTPFLLSGPRCDRAVAEEIDDPAKYGLAPPQTTVEVVVKGGQALVFYLGSPTPDGQNWYVQVEGSARLCTLAAVFAEVVSKLATEPPYPPSLERLSITADDIVRFAVEYGGERIEYKLKGDQWVINDGNDTPVFKEAWGGPALVLASLEATKVLATYIDEPAKYGFLAPRIRVQIVAKHGEIEEYALGEPTPDGQDVYATLVGSLSLFSVAADWADSLAKLVTQPPYPPGAQGKS
jgi:hypothetical protein